MTELKTLDYYGQCSSCLEMQTCSAHGIILKEDLLSSLSDMT